MRRLSPSTAISLAALVIALGSTGWAANGGNFLLGLFNSATQRTSLTANFNGSALQITNTSAGASATPLELTVSAGHPPMKVNGATKVVNLNADYLDGLSSASFVPAAVGGWHYVGDAGEPVFSNTWVNVDPAVSHVAAISQHLAFRIDNNHVVHIQGNVKSGTAQNVFVLPAAYCPKFTKRFATIDTAGLVEVTVHNGPPTAAPCNVLANFGSNANVSLDGISFPDAASDALVAAGP